MAQDALATARWPRFSHRRYGSTGLDVPLPFGPGCRRCLGMGPFRSGSWLGLYSARVLNSSAGAKGGPGYRQAVPLDHVAQRLQVDGLLFEELHDPKAILGSIDAESDRDDVFGAQNACLG